MIMRDEKLREKAWEFANTEPHAQRFYKRATDIDATTDLMADFALEQTAELRAEVERLREALQNLVTAIDVEMADPNNENRYMPIQTEEAMYEANKALADSTDGGGE